MLSASTDSFTFFFSKLEFSKFLFFFGLIAIARLFNTILNKHSESWHDILFLIFGRILSAFRLLSMMLTVSLSHGLCHIEACYLYTHLVESFIINGYWTLSVDFYASIEMITIFIFQFVNAVCHIDLFADIETFLLLWDKFYLIMAWSFMYYWIWFANLFLRICIMFIRLSVCNFIS